MTVGSDLGRFVTPARRGGKRHSKADEQYGGGGTAEQTSETFSSKFADENMTWLFFVFFVCVLLL